MFGLGWHNLVWFEEVGWVDDPMTSFDFFWIDDPVCFGVCDPDDLFGPDMANFIPRLLVEANTAFLGMFVNYLFPASIHE